METFGGAEPVVLANESFLMRGQVIRSPTNRVSVRFRSPQPASPGTFRFRFQGTGTACGALQSHGPCAVLPPTRASQTWPHPWCPPAARGPVVLASSLDGAQQVTQSSGAAAGLGGMLWCPAP